MAFRGNKNSSDSDSIDSDSSNEDLATKHKAPEWKTLNLHSGYERQRQPQQLQPKAKPQAQQGKHTKQNQTTQETKIKAGTKNQPTSSKGKETFPPLAHYGSSPGHGGSAGAKKKSGKPLHGDSRSLQTYQREAYGHLGDDREWSRDYYKRSEKLSLGDFLEKDVRQKVKYVEPPPQVSRHGRNPHSREPRKLSGGFAMKSEHTGHGAFQSSQQHGGFASAKTHSAKRRPDSDADSDDGIIEALFPVKRYIPPRREQTAGKPDGRETQGRDDGRSVRRGEVQEEEEEEEERGATGGGRNREGRGSQRNQQRNPPTQRPKGRFTSAGLAQARPAEVNLTFAKLKELASKDPSEVLTALSCCSEGLKRLLKKEQTLTEDVELTRLLLGALAKVCQCTSMPTQQHAVLNEVRASAFLRVLCNFLAMHGVSGTEESLSMIIGDSADVARTLLTLFRSSCVYDVTTLHCILQMTIKQAQDKEYNLDPAVEKKFTEFETIRTAATAEGNKPLGKNSSSRHIDEDSLTPPEDFRTLSVFPTMADLDKDELPFLRRNKASGGYRDLEHYLDVQFRLLREDFVFPLREGIHNYLQTIGAPQRNNRIRDIRVYYKVRILRTVCLQGSLGHRLHFDVSHLKRVRWEVSKRLIYGSLVCLSADNFQTLFFATVADRDPANLKEGVVDVTFEHDLDQISAIGTDTEFTMAETTAFFEAYRHVLSGLQNITTLPFDTYIVSCQKQVADPAYLDSREATYDLRPLVDDEIVLREDKKLERQGREVSYNFSPRSRPAEAVEIFDRRWPDHDLLGLDETQFEALNCALTKEFSVIQGPPGTGKTYVGLKIVKALLHNRKSWDPKLESSMLIVCYTNHALDQFLEGVVSYFKGPVVRVGSRVQSEELKQVTLNNLRWGARRRRDGIDADFRTITDLRFQGQRDMEDLKTEMDKIGLRVEGAKMEILNENVLGPFMLERHLRRLRDVEWDLKRQMLQGGFTQQGKTRKKVFCVLEWLTGLGVVLQNRCMTADDLEAADQELGNDDDEIEGEVKADEERNRLDTDDTGDRNDTRKRQRKKALAQERYRILALDISKLDHGVEDKEKEMDEEGFQIPAAHWKKFKRKLRRKVAAGDRMTEDEERRIHDIWVLETEDKWRLYRLWTHRLCESLLEEMREKERTYDLLARRQKETLMQEDKHILKNSTVIAMTTTAAARYQSVLQEIRPKVVVVEEAAEVLEGHVITTLSEGCQHLILIGDHKQLRPNPTVYKLARKYNLELSLFERMIINGLRCVTLGHQHRMRPEIAELVKPIYPDLQNHPSVHRYENVMGICSNVFFISHNYGETGDEETKSHSNEYEAQYISQLAEYLLKQGYERSRITVLTTYSGQLVLLKRYMPKKFFEGVRVTVVDNFQGEENDIILLSLVRSNDDGKIGFLDVNNRVCVALSRAKIGLFVIGNFDFLSAHGELWRTITNDLRKKGRLGEALRLYCQNHPNDNGLVIRSPEDFNFSPEGGCMKPCSTRLDCGHVCTLLCHPADQQHELYKCPKPCGRELDCEFGHRCKKFCFQECGDCEEKVLRKLPRCGHENWMPCGLPVEDFECTFPCNEVMECGHTCGDRCGQPHKCFEKILHTMPCGHDVEVSCSFKDQEVCHEPCLQELVCGHACEGTCGECFSGRLHKGCMSKCNRILVCGHECQGTSCSYCPPCEHRCENRCVHSSCKKKCGQPCAPCRERCTYECPHFKCGRLCGEPCDRPPCNEPCPELLSKCSHPCIGVCGEPCPELCRICDRDAVTEIFFGTEEEEDAMFVVLEDCGHVLEVSGMDQWMQTTTSQNEDSVQLKACPKCKVTIRTNLRYGAIIKQQLQDIETVKEKILADKTERKDILKQLEKNVENERKSILDIWMRKTRILDNREGGTREELLCMQYQMKLIDETKELQEIRRQKNISSFSKFSKAIESFQDWICRRRMLFREQEAQDAQTELLRLSHWLHLLVLQDLANVRGEILPDEVDNRLEETLRRMETGLLYTERHQESTKALLEELKKLVPESGLRISEKERVMILKAMDLRQGHWYKCRYGHVYAIGDCGGAMEESRCPECKTEIGGTKHRLVEGNAVATEMDGARFPAWSEENNLENFEFDNPDSDSDDEDLI